MIQGAVSLFKQKGFHRTTTREIARLRALASEHYMNILGRKRMFCTLFVTVFMKK